MDNYKYMAEKRRLQALKEKRRIYKAKQQLIRDALSNIVKK